MILYFNKNNRRGAVLIIALWTMSFLAVFAAYVGLRVRQRVSLLSRVEMKSQLRFLAESGIRKSISAIKFEFERNQGVLTGAGKQYLFNNPKEFFLIRVGSGEYVVEHEVKDHLINKKHYGVIDEERKININRTTPDVLKRLIRLTTDLKDDEAEKLAESMSNWRTLHSTELTGFSSDTYYANLKHPYEPKQADFEILDEMLLVKGMTRRIFEKIVPFVTVYGDGLVNINTAPREVLMALGLEGSLADKVLIVRQGSDHEESTEDDYIFQKTFDVVSEMKNFVDVQPAEALQIDRLNQQSIFKVSSIFYKIQCRAFIRRENQDINVICIYNQADRWIEYWHEK